MKRCLIGLTIACLVMLFIAVVLAALDWPWWIACMIAAPLGFFWPRVMDWMGL